MNDKRSSDEARDAYLLAALSHAPDRDVAPPADLSAAILDRAQAAVHPLRARTPTWHERRWRASLRRWMQPAPMAAFGTVAMATLIGIMWGGQSPPEATPSLRPETMAAAPPAAPAADEAPPAAQVPSVQRETVMPKLPTSPPAARPKLEARAPAAAPPSKRMATTEATPAATTITPPQAAESTARTAAAPRQEALREPAAQGDIAAKSMADAAPAVRSRAESSAVALGAAAPAAASPLAAPTIDLEAAARSDATRVRWQIAQGRQVAHGTPQRDWWRALARATQGAWQRAATQDIEGAQVVLLVDGALRGSLVFEPNHLVWREPGGQVWRAPVAADALRNWREAVGRW